MHPDKTTTHGNPGEELHYSSAKIVLINSRVLHYMFKNMISKRRLHQRQQESECSKFVTQEVISKHESWAALNLWKHSSAWRQRYTKDADVCMGVL